MHRHNLLDGNFRSMDDMRHMLETGISNSDVLALAKTLQADPLPRIKNERLIDNVQLARSVFKPNAYYGTRLANDQQVLVDVDEFGAQDIDLFITDHEGIPKNRLSDNNTSQRVKLARQQDKKVITFFGGSTIMGTGSRLPSFTIPSLVEQILHLNYQIDTVCVNRGILGMTSQDSFNMLNAEGFIEPPDCVIFYTGWNCVFNQSAIHALLESDSSVLKSETYPGMSTRHIEHGMLLQHQFNTTLAWRRALWITINKMLTSISGALRAPRGRKLANQILKSDPTVNHSFMSEVIEAITHGNTEEIAAKSAQDYLRINRLANACCKSERTQFFNFLQPCLSWGHKPMSTSEQDYVSNSPPMGGVQRKFYEQVISYPKADYFHDLTQIFDTVSEQAYIDTGHLNPYGNFLVAEKIAAQIAPALN